MLLSRGDVVVEYSGPPPPIVEYLPDLGLVGGRGDIIPLLLPLLVLARAIRLRVESRQLLLLFDGEAGLVGLLLEMSGVICVSTENTDDRPLIVLLLLFVVVVVVVLFRVIRAGLVRGVMSPAPNPIPGRVLPLLLLLVLLVAVEAYLRSAKARALRISSSIRFANASFRSSSVMAGPEAVDMGDKTPPPDPPIIVGSSLSQAAVSGSLSPSPLIPKLTSSGMYSPPPPPPPLSSSSSSLASPIWLLIGEIPPPCC